jgi:hypothetical protein
MRVKWSHDSGNALEVVDGHEKVQFEQDLKELNVY